MNELAGNKYKLDIEKQDLINTYVKQSGSRSGAKNITPKHSKKQINS